MTRVFLILGFVLLMGASAHAQQTYICVKTATGYIGGAVK